MFFVQRQLLLSRVRWLGLSLGSDVELHVVKISGKYRWPPASGEDQQC